MVMGKCGAAETSLIYSRKTDKSHHTTMSASVFSKVEVKPRLLQRLLKLALVSVFFFPPFFLLVGYSCCISPVGIYLRGQNLFWSSDVTLLWL